MKKTNLFYKIKSWTYDKDLDFDTYEQREEFCFDVLRLRRIERKLHRLDENACNGWPRLKVEYRDGKRYEYHIEDEAWRKRDERAEKTAEKQAVEIGQRWGMNLTHQGDPRGGAIQTVDDYTIRYNGLDLGQFIYD